MAPTPMTTRPMSAATTIPAIFSARIPIRARYEKSPAPRVGDSSRVAKPRRLPPIGHTVPGSQNAPSFSFSSSVGAHRQWTLIIVNCGKEMVRRLFMLVTHSRERFACAPRIESKVEIEPLREARESYLCPVHHQH